MSEFPIESRNTLLLSVFDQLGFNVQLIGNENQPKIIVDSTYAISGFIHNYMYHFTTQPFHGDVVKSFNIKYDKITSAEVFEIIENNKQRQLWKVGTYIDDVLHYYTHTLEGVAMFNTSDARFFFDEDTAIKCHSYLSDTFGHFCHVVTT